MAKNKCLLFITQLQNAYPRLSNTERRIADYMMLNSEEILEASAASIAAATKTSAATVIRFCKSCGFSGLPDLKLTLKREYDIINDSQQEAPIQPDDSLSVMKQKVLGYHNVVINTMLANWDEAAYSKAVEALLSAKHIIVLGEGGSKSTACCLSYVCLQLGLPCQLTEDSVFEILAVSNMGLGDVVLGISYTGRLRNTVESFQLAKSLGATTIGLVGSPESPILKHTDIVLNTNMVQKDFYSSMLSVRVSELAVIEVLYTMLATRLGKRTAKLRPEKNFAEEIRRLPV